jgi:predicted metalloprotease with PDZ domain
MPFRRLRWLRIALLALVLPLVPATRTAAQAVAPRAPIVLDVDAHEALRGLIHVREQIPVVPGPLTLAYPKWIPGEHSPAGPLVNVGGFVMTAGGATVPWRRDLDDSYLVHVDVPAGATTLDVAFDFFGAPVGDYSDARFATPTILAINWNKVMVVPNVADYRTITLAPSLRLPGSDWQYATALETTAHTGASITFAPLTMEMLVDSPLDAGTVTRRWALGSIDGAPVDLAVFADTPDQLDASEATIATYRNLVAEMGALYRARHFRHYTFLLTVSDAMAGNGVEHHQSSDDGEDGDFLTDADTQMVDGDLLPHEFNHSWDGKFRRPADLATLNLQVPMHDDLLWVYEGMTQYYGDTQATRSGIRTQAEWRELLADSYAYLDAQTGRRVRPLQDTADDAAYLYSAPQAFEMARRGVDFYSEGELMWLEADMIIRLQTNGRKSLDDVARAFFGRTSTGPEVITYTRDDIVAALEAVQPYDWRAFLAARIDAIAPHPPDPFTRGGWRVVFKSTPSPFVKKHGSVRKSVDARYSIGIAFKNDGTITDVVDGSPAALAGIAPTSKLTAIDDRALKDEPRAQFDAALTAAGSGTPLRLLVLTGGVYRNVTIAYTGGPRYPDLERIPNVPDLLDAASAPRRGT